ncbi:bifunctional aspartate kinase/diaminopimelate decarboxylase [Marinicella litoralis]|uniref:bifunctional aspartate kinase/diaminopimelate decarboxylase n=1 Tax=Marinicella litoralis TaxID=644220 RepID=UPI0013C33DF9|nr:bifunctional aspartate kinase/diaminopimelate decarboxylase [Marinicella litoralis]
MNSWVVLKFGGTSVSDLKKWQVIVDVVKQRIKQGYKVLVVHSAAQGLTNLLTRKITNKQSIYTEFVAQLSKLAIDLSVDIDLIENQLTHLKRLNDLSQLSIKQQAELLAMGELCTHQVILAYLQNQLKTHSLDPKKWLVSSRHDKRHQDAQILSAKCDINPLENINDTLTDPFYVMPGFVASDSAGNTVLLGRGGSDTTAAYMAVILNAKQLEIWTDVHGIFSANPHSIPNARLLLNLGYQEAREIAASGGKVLHPRCILPVEQHDIPLLIKNTNHPQAAGTVLASQHSATKPRVSAINSRHQVTLVSMESMNMWHQAGFMGDVFNIYKKLGLSIDLVSTAQTNVTISLDNIDNILNPEILSNLQAELTPLCEVEIYQNCSAVTLVGYRIRALADKISPVISSFADQRIYITTQSSNDLNQTFVVDEDQADKLARALHEVLIIEDKEIDDFGPTWAELVAEKSKPTHISPAWWQTQQQPLIELSNTHSPCYVYHLDTIKHQIDQLKSLTAIDRIFYASKANSHPQILNFMHQQQISLETVSPGEIERVLKSCKGIKAESMLFTPNFAPIHEYQDALDQGLFVTIDNPSLLYDNPEVFQNQEVILRLDPGHGSGHHRYVRTAGSHSKFGIPSSDIEQIAQWCKDHQVKVIGLHAHSGSGILDHSNWPRIAEYLGSCLSFFPTAKIVNVGGGLGIRENPGDMGLDLQALNNALLTFKKSNPSIELWMEPGRFLVAHSGVLMAKVTQTKWKSSHGYIGIETGMNSLIRPALYGAWHNIVNLSRLNQDAEYTATVVGPMCESGDVLGVDRKMPRTSVGDTILIANTGAYGAVMASNYNLREPAKEFVI